MVAAHHIKNWNFSHTVVDGKERTYSTWVTSYNLTKPARTPLNDLFIVNDNLNPARRMSHRSRVLSPGPVGRFL